MNRIILTLSDGRRTLMPVSDIGDCIEVDEEQLRLNDETTWAFVGVFRKDLNKSILVREDLEQIQNLIETSGILNKP